MKNTHMQRNAPNYRGSEPFFAAAFSLRRNMNQNKKLRILFFDSFLWKTKVTISYLKKNDQLHTKHFCKIFEFTSFATCLTLRQKYCHNTLLFSQFKLGIIPNGELGSSFFDGTTTVIVVVVVLVRLQGYEASTKILPYCCILLLMGMCTHSFWWLECENHLNPALIILNLLTVMSSFSMFQRTRSEKPIIRPISCSRLFLNEKKKCVEKNRAFYPV